MTENNSRPRGRPRIPWPDRFWEKVDKNGPVVTPELGACWLWTAAKQRGYGVIGDGNGHMLRATHASLMLDGRDPGNLYACHHCDERGCVRPSHLFIGTALDNARDAARKHRFVNNIRFVNPRIGLNRPRLSDETTHLIRSRARGGERGADIARSLGISATTVSRIVNRTRHK